MARLFRILCLVAAAGTIAVAADAQRTSTPRGAPPQTPPTVQRQPLRPGPPVWEIGRIAKFACPALVKLRLPGAEILSSSEVMGPSFTPPGAATEQNLPPFCRVVGRAFPTRASNIMFEVWLPLKNYNDRYEQAGNGGFAGIINYSGIAEGVRRGFASASTDDGHQGQIDGSFALGPPAKIVDFGWRSLKATTDAAKSIVQAFYGAQAKYAYFFGCSDGGREAMMEAQRFPTDFDGIIAAAPANNWTHQFTALAYNTQAAYNPTTFAQVLPQSLLGVLAGGVRKQCAGHDGGLPGDLYLTDPRACVIDWTKIQCQASQNPATCLDAAQVAAVQAIYAGAKNSTGTFYEGYEPGSEDAAGTWQPWITGPGNIPNFFNFGLQTAFGEGFFAYFVFKTYPTNLFTLDMNTALGQADAFAPDLNAMDPDLSAFHAHGGKLIQYAGWADPAVAPRGSIDYYEAVRTAMAASYAQQQDWYRLFMAPGMGHCAGGPGPDAFGNVPAAPAPAGQGDAGHDVLMALMRWRENGAAPAKIIATHYQNDDAMGGAGAVEFQRPLCPYPALPRYSGIGLGKDAGSYACEAHVRTKLDGKLLK
ncbi:MAG TPA: tannase/feruloyl esterase family alpha/beta hydrolase [Rhizomicrobium sp.]|jgi:feruloyl esterase